MSPKKMTFQTLLSAVPSNSHLEINLWGFIFWPTSQSCNSHDDKSNDADDGSDGGCDGNSDKGGDAVDDW